MPQIAPFTARIGDLPAQQPLVGNSTSGVADAAAGFNRTVGAVANQYLNRLEQSDLAHIQASTATARAELFDRLEDYKREYGHDPFDKEFSSRFLEKAGESLQRYENGVQTAAGRQAHAVMMESLLGEYSIRADAAQAEMAGSRAQLDLLTAMNSSANLLMRDPNQFPNIMQEQALLISLNENLTSPQRDELLLQSRKSFASAAVRGIAMKNPQQALNQLASGTWDMFLDDSDRAGLTASLMGQVEADRKERERVAAKVRKEKGDQAIKDILELDDKGQLSKTLVLQQKDWLTPEDFKLALSLVNTIEPSDDNGAAIIQLETTLDRDPELVPGLATELYRQGKLTGDSLRTYRSAGNTRARQQGFVSQRESSWENITVHFKPSQFDRFDAAKNARFVLAKKEFFERTADPGLSDKEIEQIEQSVVARYSKGDAYKKAWQTTNMGRLQNQKDQLARKSEEIFAQHKAGTLPRAEFQARMRQIRSAMQEVLRQEAMLEKGKS